MGPIKWADIEAECGGYRAGFVSVFKKYEGQPTDEKDAYGRAVKVTRASFARHAGIGEKTFYRWVQKDVIMTTIPPHDTKEAGYKRWAQSAIRNAPDAVVEAIMQAPDQTADRIFHELKLRRAGEDRTPAHQKAVEATVREATQPIMRSIATTHVELCIQALEEAAAALAEAMTEDALTTKALARIDKAHDKFVIARHEAGFKLEVGR